MSTSKMNPFTITKAVDFSDQEIRDYWVELTNPASFFSEIIKPNAAMPMIILGGKGSGKTHIMRRYSHQIQRIGGSGSVLSDIRTNGYVGIYVRCGGLNASRFFQKGISEDIWTATFAYYMELWFSQNILAVFKDCIAELNDQEQTERSLCNEIEKIFDIPPEQPLSTLDEVINYLSRLQKSVDANVNNAPFLGTLNITVNLSRGSLIFGIPKLLERLFNLENVVFLYLIDEFENLSINQQIYINTLIREKQEPASFRIGARLYGIKTSKTLSGGEENREGSEYESVYLDANMRSWDKYATFVRELFTKRLSIASFIHTETMDQGSISKYFELVDHDLAIREMISRYTQNDKPYFVKLKDKLEAALTKRVAPGVSTNSDIEKILANLAFPQNPVLEKCSTIILYKGWSRKQNLLQLSVEIRAWSAQHHDKGDVPEYKKILSYFKTDLVAQIYRECRNSQSVGYTGIENYITMSKGLPRNFLIILKHVYKWASFNGEQPFGNTPISLTSQEQGVKEAANWFFRDAQIAVDNNKYDVEKSISMLAELFKEIRFSDKPAESSPCAFSVDLTTCTSLAKSAILRAETLSLLISVDDGARQKNSMRTVSKYQINSMLAPRWDLPIALRGTIGLSDDEVNAIFDPNFYDDFTRLKSNRLSRMNAPFQEASRAIMSSNSAMQSLPEEQIELL